MKRILIAILASAVSIGSVAALAQAPVLQTTPNLEFQGDGFVRTTAAQADGSILIGGSFTAVNGLARNNIARIRPDGSVDQEWNPAPNSSVEAITLDALGNIYVGGYFTNIGGMSRSRLAKITPNATATVDLAWLHSADREVLTIVASPGGELIVGGNFTTIDGVARNRIAKFATAGIGELDMTWNPSASSTVHTVVLDTTGSSIYVGGAFTSIGGLARNRLAKLSLASSTGSVDPTWNPNANERVYSLALNTAGDIFAGGQFSSIGGQLRFRIAKLSGGGTGAVDPVWNPAASTNSVVSEVWSDGGGWVYAGGTFTSIGGSPRTYLARLSETGAGLVDADWAPVLDSSVATFARGSGDSVYVGGQFSSIDGQLRKGIARFGGNDQVFFSGFE